MSQMPVKWVDGYYDYPEYVPKRKIGSIDIEPTPVVPLSALRRWLKEEFRCDCGRGLFGEPHLVWCKHRIYGRLLAGLGEAE